MSRSSSWDAWPGDVDERHVLPQDLGALAEELVDHARDRALVARDDPGGEDHEVPLADAQGLVLRGRHEGQGGVRLALASRGDDHLAVGRQRRQVLEGQERPVGDAEVAQLRGQAHVGLHAPPEERDLAPEGGGEVQDLLDAVDVRGERRDDDAPGGAAEPVAQRAPDLVLGGRGARPVDVRGVGHEAEDAPLAELGEAMIVRALSVDRVRIELEVPRVDEGADRRLDPVAEAVDDRVGHADRLHAETADVERAPGLDRHEPGAVQEAVLAQTLAGERERHPGPVHRDVELAQEVRERPDVVLVSMGEDDPAHLLAPRQEVREVRDDVIHPGHLVVREHEPAVDGQEVLARLQQHHVETDLPEAAEREDANAGLDRRVARGPGRSAGRDDAVGHTWA